jgi:hypothetical protein
MLIIPTKKYKINISELETYLFNTSEKLHFNTNEGIFEIFGDKIYLMNEKKSGDSFLLENKKEKYEFNLKKNNDLKKEIFYIPINFKCEKIITKQYQLHKNSILTLNIENGNYFYFTTKENEITNSVREDMISFLCLLKLYN